MYFFYTNNYLVLLHYHSLKKNIQGDTFIWKTPFFSEMTHFFSNPMYPTYNTATKLQQLFTDLEAGVDVGLTICAQSFEIQEFWSLIYEKWYTFTISQSHFSHKVNMQISPMMSVSQFTAPFGLEQPSALITKKRFNSNTTADAFEAALHWLALAACVCLSKKQLFKTLNRRRVKMQCRFLPPEGASCQNFQKLKQICRACVSCWICALYSSSSPQVL